MLSACANPARVGYWPRVNGDDRREEPMPDQEQLLERIHAVETAGAGQAATLAGMQATQAAAQAGTMATMVAGSVGLIVGIILGWVIARAR